MRVPYATGMAQMWDPVCQTACPPSDEACLTHCMGDQLETSSDEYIAEQSACDAAGGIRTSHMPACETALHGLLHLTNDSSVFEALTAVNAIYAHCSAKTLCIAETPAH